MSTDPDQPTADTESERMWTTRRTVIRGAGVAGLLTTGVGTASAREDEDDYEWPIGEPDEDAEAGEWEDPLPADSDYTDQQIVTDDTGVIQYSVPADWGDVAGVPTELGPTLVAAPDIEGYATSWDVPGIEVILTTELGADPGGVLDTIADFREFCEDGGRQRVGFPGYEFESQMWYHCGGGETIFLTMAGVSIGDSIGGRPPGDGAMDAPYVVLVGAQITTEQDLGVIHGAINSLQTRSPGSQNGLPTPSPDQQNETQRQDEGALYQVGYLESGQTVQGEHPGGFPHMYSFRANAGDQLVLEVARGEGGGGQLDFRLMEDWGVIDWVVIEADGTDWMTGQQQPFVLSGMAQASTENLVMGHTVSIGSSPYPEGFGPYAFRFENHGR